MGILVLCTRILEYDFFLKTQQLGDGCIFDIMKIYCSTILQYY